MRKKGIVRGGYLDVRDGANDRLCNSQWKPVMSVDAGVVGGDVLVTLISAKSKRERDSASNIQRVVV